MSRRDIEWHSTTQIWLAGSAITARRYSRGIMPGWDATCMVSPGCLATKAFRVGGIQKPPLQWSQAEFL